MVRIKFEYAIALSSITRNIPVSTPKRLKVIVERFEDMTGNVTAEDYSKMIDIEIDIGYRYNYATFFIDNEDMLTEIDKVFQESNKCLKSSHGKIILPKTEYCHEKPVIFMSGHCHSLTGANCVIYSLEGTFISKTFSAKCQMKECNKSFTPFFEEDIVEGVVVRKYYKPDGKYFGTTRDSVLEVKLLEHISSLIFGCSAEFTNLLCSLNTTIFDGKQKMSINVLEDNFFMYNIANILPLFPMTVKRYLNRTINVEHFCSQAYPLIKKLASDNYIKHECKGDKGCGLRIAVIDGNEKAKRKLCKAPKEHIQENIGRLNYYKLCVNNPDRGSRSAYCEDHAYLNNTSKEIKKVSTTVQIDLRPKTRQFIKNLQETKLLDENLVEKCDFGCRKEKNVKKEYEKTAGVISLVRTCGIRLGTYEAYTQESPSQLVMALVDKFGLNPDPNDLKIVCLDIACAVHPFLEKRAQHNEVLARYAKLDFVLDTFHAKHHKNPECMVNSNGKYNPKLDKYKYLFGSNLEAAETSFVILNKFKNTCNYMTAGKRMTFITLLEDTLNYKKELEQKLAGTNVVAGYTRG